MNIGGGEAADQLVRMMLSGSEVAVRLGGSALKNMLALTMALAKNNKTISGKINLGKMLRETRDLRQFPMTPEQYRQFSKLAKKQKILFSAIRDKDGTGKLIDVILPITELDRANMIFERVGYLAPEPAAPQREQKPPREERERPQKQREEKGKAVDPPERKAPQRAQKGPVEKSRQEGASSKKDSPSQRASPGTRSSSSSRSKAGPTARTSDRPSVEGRLKAYRGELDRRRKSVPVKSKTKTRPKSR
ncbi:DUF3801 domain-containing protein [uncultured Oscillibacter sp.]|uniref:DUF3801 domain-containing protein n=1 Tax=uncultured Oscillibacter sp. TaxID=876091 RepID=UPI002631BD2A|nr:DUF3801 domain-containing protein [uncultured Oscillibacter sp.]